MTNADMKPNRFGRWAAARAKVKAIRTHLAAGGQVVISNHLHATTYKSKHVEYFEARKSGAYVRSGKKMLCFDGNAVRFYR